MTTHEHSVVDSGKLDLEALRRLTARPALFAPHEAPFWDDPHISRQMLAAHLDPNWDAASRRHETIDRSVDWLVAHLGLRAGQRVLDLGCGPGLYCTRLHRHGLVVTGVDYSRNSIAYATQHAREHDLAIEYIYRDYLTLDYAAEFDAITLIYYDIGVLSDRDRDALLARVHRALKPGGAFVFDVLTPAHPRPADGSTAWGVHPTGFWKPGPYLELTSYFEYPEAAAALRQVAVIEADGRASLYRIWDRFYSVETITPVLEAHGLQVQDVWGDLTGRAYEPGSPSLGVVARKR